MKLSNLKKAVSKARQDLQLAERKAAELRRSAKAARARAEQVRLEHRRLRKAAKQAKKLALAAEDQACERRRIWEKAEKRLAKALKKLAKAKGGGANKTVKAAARPRKPASPKPAVKKTPSITPKTQKPAVLGQAPPASPGAAKTNPASPTV